MSTEHTSGYSSSAHTEHTGSSCEGITSLQREKGSVAMATLTAATASSRPRDPQLMMRVRTPRRQTLGNKQKHGFKLGEGRDWSRWSGGAVPNQGAPGVTDQAKQNQEADEHVKQQQAEVPQPPVKGPRLSPADFRFCERVCIPNTTNL